MRPKATDYKIYETKSGLKARFNLDGLVHFPVLRDDRAIMGVPIVHVSTEMVDYEVYNLESLRIYAKNFGEKADPVKLEALVRMEAALS